MTTGLLAACGGDDDDDSGDTSGDSSEDLSSSDDSTSTDKESTDEGSSEDGSEDSGAEPTAGGTIAIGINLEPDNLDPAVTPYAVSHTVMMNIYDPLVWRGKDGEFYPGLAESWEVAEDGLGYSFVLKEGVTFHDGTPFNGEAVQKFLDRVIDPETLSGFAANLIGPYESTEVVDDTNIKITMSAPFAPFLDGLSQAFLGIPSPTAVEADPQAFGRNPVGTGFMKFSEWVDKDHITLVRNEDYTWGSPVFENPGPAHLESVTFRFFTDHATRLAALEAGDVQMIEMVPESSFADLQSNDDYTVTSESKPGLPGVLEVNTAMAPTDDVAVRQAMNYALDQQTLIDIALFGTTIPASGPLSSVTPYYSEVVEEYYPFDLDEAARVLEEAGWTMGSNDIYEKDGQPLTVIWAASDATDAFSELLQSHMRQAGIDVQIQKLASSAVTEAIRNDEANVVYNSWISSDPVILANIFHSENIEAGLNVFKVDNPELDELMEKGEQTLDTDERASIYEDIQKLIMDEAYIVALYENTSRNARESKYEGVKLDFRSYIWLLDAFVEE